MNTVHFPGQWQFSCTYICMAKPDMPNFSIGGRVVVGAVVVVVIIALLYFMGVL